MVKDEKSRADEVGQRKRATNTPTAPPRISPWMTVTAAAEYSSRGKPTIFAALKSGDLRGSQTCPGGSWRIHVEAVDLWMMGRGREWELYVRPVTVKRVS